MGVVLVGTPIGNLGDLSDRARETLLSADVIACEDKRHSEKILGPLGVTARRIAYHEHNEDQAARAIIELAKEGKTIAVLSDAGMPGISDPGYRLVRLCLEENIPITCVPGPSAVVTALALSGLPTDRFAFEGFLPAKKEARRRRIESLMSETRTMVLYESPHRILDLLEDLNDLLGDRPTSVARELTKTFEEILRGTPAEIRQSLAERDQVKGEMVVVLAPALESDSTDLSDEELLLEIKKLRAAGLSRRDSALAVALLRAVPKKRTYTLSQGED